MIEKLESEEDYKLFMKKCAIFQKDINSQTVILTDDTEVVQIAKYRNINNLNFIYNLENLTQLLLVDLDRLSDLSVLEKVFFPQLKVLQIENAPEVTSVSLDLQVNLEQLTITKTQL